MQRHSGIVSWKVIFLAVLVQFAFFSKSSISAQSQPFKLKWAGAGFDAFTLDGVEYWTVEDGGRIRHTSNVDTGTWTFQTVPTEVKDTLHRIFFLSDGLHGWAVGQNGWIINTVDGGAHWSTLARISSVLPYLDGPFEELYGIQFVDPNRGWVMGTRGIWYTTNGGAGGSSWDPAILQGTSGATLTQADTESLLLYGLDILPVTGSTDIGLGLACGEPGWVLRSTNVGGTTWRVTWRVQQLCPLTSGPGTLECETHVCDDLILYPLVEPS